MEHIDQRLQTLPPKRQKQFQRILKEYTGFFSARSEEVKQEIIEKIKSKLLQYLANEEKEKIEGRKHGSKGKKHREKGPEQVRRIEKKLDENKVNYALLLSELFNVSLRKKDSHKGIRYIGLCPFHNEKTPSLSVAPDIGVIKCYGCGRGHRPVHLLSDAFNIKYSRALGMLEKYIFTPKEDEDRKKQNQYIMQIKQITPEQEEKKEFVRFLLHRNQESRRPYLPKKKFKEEFAKWKEERTQKNQANENALKNQPNGDDDDLPF